MNLQTQAPTKVFPKPALISPAWDILQRTPAMSGHPAESFPATVERVRPGHNFADVNVYPPVHRDAASDDAGAGEFSPGTGEVLPVPLEQPDAEKMDDPAPKAKCPTKTVVDKSLDMTPEAIKKGYRTGYGITSVMRVEPTSTVWDGTQIVEATKQTRNTCPEEFGISPCNGTDTFTVGKESNSSILGKLAATPNRFYDFHFTRWNKGSLLHDRNPKDIDSCEIACEQKYSCGGNVIGTHTVTRTFTKGTSGSRNVTLVNVTKS
jgi:hypothetical protein